MTKSNALDLLPKLQTHTAELAIGASTLRNQGAPLFVANARAFLKALDLRRFNVETPTAFRVVLDEETENLQRAFPAGGRWGAARKALNIFLRDVLYNHYLCEEYGFRHLESWLELPLDSQVARGLLAEPEGSTLARWRAVKLLNPILSDEYQSVAEQVAQRLASPEFTLI